MDALDRCTLIQALERYTRILSDQPRPTNLLIARLFEEIAQSLEVAGEQGHRMRAYRRAARSLAALTEPLETLAADGHLREIPYVGASLAALIEEFLSTGGIRTHARLTAEHPPGLAPLLQARGFGPAKVESLHAALGIANLDDVERAGQDGRLADTLGQRRADELLAELPVLRKPVRALRLKSAWEEVHLLLDQLPRGTSIHVAGQARRGCDMVIGGLDLVAQTRTPERLLDHVAALPSVVDVLERTPERIAVLLYDRLEVRLTVASEDAFGTAMVLLTGSSRHLARLRQLSTELPRCRTEQELYARLGLPWIPPELREDDGEIEAALDGALPRLVQQSDLKGDLHCHTLWTDGSESLEAMARAARSRGYAYMALTDHSRSLTITNGLSIERLEEARRHVQQLNHALAPFVILLGTEMDILQDGSLDYPDDVLSTLDYVSASVHSRFKQAGPVMTERILRAVRHPLVRTLNHPHGRLLGARPAYAVDMPLVIETAARVGCAMEVSGDPARMDLDGGWARRVKAAGGRCTISSDAHSTLDYDNIWLGVASARRGWLEPQDVLNTRPLEELRALLARRLE
ncbi:MAG: DNA polymerase III [Chloroflexi bacterium]|nr:DNA polymerase III [Chloroflexota bacterium]